MRTGRWLACVVALGLFTGLSCAAHSDEGARADSKAQSGNDKSAADEKVSVSADGAAVEVKKSGEGASVEVKKSGEGSSSVTIGGNGIGVSTSNEGEVSAQDVVKIAGMNQNLTYECKGRSFNVAGTSNTVKLTGQCESLRVAGTTNQVDVEAVATINVSGIRNHVTWERGVNNKRPSISNSGINNSVSEKGK